MALILPPVFLILLPMVPSCQPEPRLRAEMWVKVSVYRTDLESLESVTELGKDGHRVEVFSFQLYVLPVTSCSA